VTEYAIVIEKGPRSYSAYCPDVPGCVAAAKTRALAEKLMREALELHIETMRECGEAVPPSTSIGAVVRIPA
jgi:predicted RNase H-like HicB family nuclease